MNIKVRDLKQTDKIKNSDKFMVLVDDDSNLVKNISKGELLDNIISPNENNAIKNIEGNLWVNSVVLSYKFVEYVDVELPILPNDDETTVKTSSLYYADDKRVERMRFEDI